MVSLSDLQTAILQRCDIPATSNYVTSGELTSYINNSAAELYDALVTRYEDYAVIGPIQFTVTNVPDSGDAYTLPADFYKLRGVDRQAFSAGGYWDTVRPYNFLERNFYNTTTSLVAAPVQRFQTWYRIIGQELYLLPWTTVAGTYRFWYTPFLPPLVNAGDTLPAYLSGPAWHEYIITDCIIKIYTKQEDDPSPFMAQKEALLKRIYDVAVNRDEGDTDRVQDVHKLYGWNGSWRQG